MYDHIFMIQFKQFTGGMLETHAYLLEFPKGRVLIDAPEGADRAFAQTPIDLLLLTHGHFDHTFDAARVVKRHGCPVAMHADTVEMLADPYYFRRFGFDMEIQPLSPSFLLDASGATGEVPEIWSRLGWAKDKGSEENPLQIFHIPGHCPGSLCFYFPKTAQLFGGDVLFQSGVGRWDLPGGSKEELIAGIQNKLLPLPPETRVYPGHGPSTTIGEEKIQNPYVQAQG